jgi:hypothetical protein
MKKILTLTFLFALAGCVLGNVTFASDVGYKVPKTEQSINVNVVDEYQSVSMEVNNVVFTPVLISTPCSYAVYLSDAKTEVYTSIKDLSLVTNSKLTFISPVLSTERIRWCSTNTILYNYTLSFKTITIHKDLNRYLDQIKQCSWDSNYIA